MSHNKIRVGSSTPDATGNISLNLSDLSDVSGTPSDGQNLQYTSSTGLWTPATLSSSSNEYFLWGQGEARDYSYSPAANALNSSIRRTVRIFLYDSNHVNTISGSTLYTQPDSGSTNNYWFDFIDLPAATYRFTLICNVVFSSSGYFEFGLQGTTGNLLTNWARIGSSSAQDNICTSIQTVRANERVRPYIGLASGVAGKTGQGTFLSQHTSFLIEKLS